MMQDGKADPRTLRQSDSTLKDGWIDSPLVKLGCLCNRDTQLFFNSEKKEGCGIPFSSKGRNLRW